MRARLQQLVAWLLPTVVGGVMLGTLEAGVVAARRPELFLSLREFARYWLIASAVSISLLAFIASFCVFVALLLRRIARERFVPAVALVTGMLSAPLAAWALWSLSSGRRLQGLPYRPVAVSGAALLTSLALIGALFGLMRLLKASAATRRAVASLLWIAVGGGLVANAVMWHRQYPAYHWLLLVLTFLLAAAAVRLWSFWTPKTSRAASWICGLGMLAALGAPFLLRDAAHAPNLRYAMIEAAPNTGRLLAKVRLPATTVAHAPPSHTLQPRANEPNKPGISLRGEDILIITIDALRADRLRAYGSHQDLTPELDRLALDSAVFSHAYTPTPHTSYAIGSLWTGKYLRPVLSLPASAKSHPTLPKLARQFGYRTAAFYPPAVFFVDEDRFAELNRTHFGFEYVKEMFAPAEERVAQLKEYLEQAQPGHPLLVWVHLFEPHEPYEAKAEFARGTEPEQRYDAEVARADAATGALIAAFRKRSPNATVILTADHGEEFGEHGGHHHGTTLFDEQVRVPLLWSSPGRVQPRRIDAPAQLVDLAPTLLSALGIPRDPRMRGADLSALLNGAPPSPQLSAFASIEDLRMLTDGRDKLVCETSEGACRLYDLNADPTESRDASAQKPEVVARLSQQLSELVASIPEGEVLAMQSGDAWPKALARARLGDLAAREELQRLLGDPRSAVRAEALRAIAQARVASALPVVQSLAEHDTDASVREEAALTATVLGAEEYNDRVRALLVLPADVASEQRDLARRAAFALLPSSGKLGEQLLFELAADKTASLAERERALAAIGSARAAGALRHLEPLLADVRLRPAVARALGQVGDRNAIEALLRALAKERYPEARTAEIEALVTLRAKRVLPKIVRFLGTETGLPGGLEEWARLQGPGRSGGGVLIDLRRGFPGPPLRGDWRCRKEADSAGPPGCRPATGRTELQLPRFPPPGDGRVVLSVWATSSSDWLRMAEREISLHRGRNELAYPIKRVGTPPSLSLRASAGTYVELIGVVPKSPDVPPPPPEPWQPEHSEAAPPPLRTEN